jgi:hypothetical protein
MVQVVSALVPAALLVHWIGSWWKKAHYERKEEGSVEKLVRRIFAFSL